MKQNQSIRIFFHSKVTTKLILSHLVALSLSLGLTHETLPLLLLLLLQASLSLSLHPRVLCPPRPTQLNSTQASPSKQTHIHSGVKNKNGCKYLDIRGFAAKSDSLTVFFGKFYPKSWCRTCRKGGRTSGAWNWPVSGPPEVVLTADSRKNLFFWQTIRVAVCVRVVCSVSVFREGTILTVNGVFFFIE